MAIPTNMQVLYISSGTIFRCEFNGDVCFVIRVKKFLKTLSRLRSEMRKLDNVMAKIQDHKISQDIVKTKILDRIQVVAQLEMPHSFTVNVTYCDLKV